MPIYRQARPLIIRVRKEIKRMGNFRAGLFMAITFVIGVGSASNINTVIRSSVWRFGDSRTIEKYFQANSVRKLQLGAGGNAPAGWLNSDIEPGKEEIYLDAAGRYPFGDGSFQYIFAEHVIEHIPWEAGLRMLKECYRVLAKGGKIRIVTPNLTKFIQLLTDSPDDVQRRFIAAKLRFHGWPVTPVIGAYILNKEVRDWGHQFLYDSATLRKTFEQAGFNNVREYSVEEKPEPVF